MQQARRKNPSFSLNSYISLASSLYWLKAAGHDISDATLDSSASFLSSLPGLRPASHLFNGEIYYKDSAALRCEGRQMYEMVLL